MPAWVKITYFGNTPPSSVWIVNETFVLMFCSLQHFCKLFLTTNHQIFCRPQLHFNSRYNDLQLSSQAQCLQNDFISDLIWCDRAACKNQSHYGRGPVWRGRWKMILNIAISNLLITPICHAAMVLQQYFTILRWELNPNLTWMTQDNELGLR